MDEGAAGGGAFRPDAAEADEHLRRERVALVRAVEGDFGDTVGRLVAFLAGYSRTRLLPRHPRPDVLAGAEHEGHADDRATNFEEEVVAFPEVIACHMIAGEADYLLEVTVPDLDAYQRFLVGKLLNLPLVREAVDDYAAKNHKRVTLAGVRVWREQRAFRRGPAGPRANADGAGLRRRSA